MKIALKIFVLGLALWAGGCADFYQNNLDRAYQSGNLSAHDYYSLKAQQEEARQKQIMMYQQQQNAVMRNYANTINTTPATPMFSTPFLQETPQRGSIDGLGAQQSQPRLPSGLAVDQMRRGQGVPTGRTRLAADGVLWQEYKTWDGASYWVRSQ